jgi:hypothetical protein
MRLNRSLILSLTIVSLLTACQMEPAGNTGASSASANANAGKNCRDNFLRRRPVRSISLVVIYKRSLRIT